MSGIEIAGLVLGAIPVAQASYTTIGNFFRAWRNAGSQISRLQKLHKIEANMFRVSIRVLFSSLLDKRTVTEMLDQPKHRLWTDKKIRAKLGTIFSEDTDISGAINANIELVKKSLTEIEDIFRSVEVCSHHDRGNSEADSRSRSVRKEQAPTNQKINGQIE
jgi:hypothetical protein